MIAALPAPALLLHALAVTGLAVVVAVPLLVALVRLPAGGAASLAAVLLLAALLPLPVDPRLGRLPTEVVALLAFVALPPAWGLRRLPPAALRIAASLAGPALTFRRVWLPLAAPWLLVGLAWGFARALAGAGLVGPAGLLAAAAAWPLLRALATRRT